MPNKKDITIIGNKLILGKEFNIYGTREEPLFLVKDIAAIIGYGTSNASKLAKEIDEEEKLMARINNTSALFVTEGGLYEILFRSTKPIAKEFKKEVKQILKELRTNGVVILENATEESIDFAITFGPYRVRKTFAASNDIFNTWDQLTNHKQFKKINNTEKVKISKLALKGLDDRTTTRDSQTMEIKELKLEILQAINKFENKKNGAIKGHKTRLIKSLEGTIEEFEKYTDFIECNLNELAAENSLYNPDELEYIEIPLHPISKNKAYENLNYKDLKTGKYETKRVFTKEYLKFRKDMEQFKEDILEQFAHIDFNKKVIIHTKYIVCSSGYDSINFLETLADTLVYIGLAKSDNKFISGIQEIISVDKKENCKIYLCIKQY